MSVFYKGFSTKVLDIGNKGFTIRGKETVKQDLYNHIFTAKGERVMMPNFGTRIPSLAFEPIDERTLRIIEDDLREVVNFDPRVELIDLKVLPLSDNNAIIAIVSVRYLELGGIESFNIDVPVGSGNS